VPLPAPGAPSRIKRIVFPLEALIVPYFFEIFDYQFLGLSPRTRELRDSELAGQDAAYPLEVFDSINPGWWGFISCVDGNTIAIPKGAKLF